MCSLRSDGHTYRHIQEVTGVPASYGPSLVKRQCRVTRTTVGWTSQMVLDALRRYEANNGRAPRFRDAEGHPGLPSPKTIERHFGTWNQALRVAGIRPAYGDRRVRPWTQEEMIQTFCLWRLRKDRWPNRDDMASESACPSPATTRRHFGGLRVRLDSPKRYSHGWPDPQRTRSARGRAGSPRP